MKRSLQLTLPVRIGLLSAAILILSVFSVVIVRHRVMAGPEVSFKGVLTYHNNNLRTGWNSNETALTLKNVNSSSFGKLFVIPADGLVDAEPLYAPAVSIPGNGTHNVLFVATEHGSVY